MRKQKKEPQHALNQAHQRYKQPSAIRQWLTAAGSKQWLLATVLCLSSVTVSANSSVEQLGIKILAELPHDPAAFTQGLLLYKGHFYESTGLYGHSSLRKVQPDTGEVVAKRKLDSGYFGEGLARVGQQLIQLTWRESQALVYDVEDLSLQQVFNYQGEGWGLCFDGEQLWMSDGSSVLQQRNPQDFSQHGQLSVTLHGEPLEQLNELACVGEYIYANIWQDHRLVRINKTTGHVEAEIDASALVAASGRGRDPEAVLNGIAYDAQTEVFYLTGKLWPKIFKVQWQEK
ncbi:glutaminyl-peptide cyclotransferase [Oceanisphaera sp. IT1-181]|uniref:glutaminyl-peptide cyclotransferase n=1 Tax=Oceanisphaera sp. IT1-181 TaxID=3081199 RepID=UPI0029C9E393|nr:glutaminyl-peptide cyclotransferase [Oceanisphaera sp. IT1-181]